MIVLQKISVLLNQQENIWFNMQTHDMPSRMNFNLNSASWKPLFKSPSLTQGLSTIQPDALVFPETDIAYVRNLEEKIERTLKDSIMNWRPRHVTRWNRSCSSALKQTLEGMELERYVTTMLVKEGRNFDYFCPWSFATMDASSQLA